MSTCDLELSSQELATEDKNLEFFLLKRDSEYEAQVKTIDLFNQSLTSKLSSVQKIFFVKTFYHARGHFYKFLWFLGNHAPNKFEKEKILYNLAEEFGDLVSHEDYYFQFAKFLNAADISDEFTLEKHYLPFLRKFNKDHIVWLKERNWESRLSAFSAYERLDNVDYKNLYLLGKSLGASDKDLTFFIIHGNADHFDRTEESLLNVWVQDPSLVEEAFDFIYQHQIGMWKKLSDSVFEYK